MIRKFAGRNPWIIFLAVIFVVSALHVLLHNRSVKVDYIYRQPHDLTDTRRLKLHKRPPIGKNNLPLQKSSNISPVDRLLRAINHADKGHNSICSQRISESGGRYGKLLSDYSRHYFIASNIHQNSPILPNFIHQLLHLIDTLGRRQVYVSIYESGSSDETRMYLELLRILLDKRSIAHYIVFESEITTGQREDGGNDRKFDESTHRIEFLAWVRNQALKPLDRLPNRQTFDRIIFLNDVYFCADDIHELVFQSLLNNASLTCGLDFDGDDKLGFYDTCMFCYSWNLVDDKTD